MYRIVPFFEKYRKEEAYLEKDTYLPLPLLSVPPVPFYHLLIMQIYFKTAPGHVIAVAAHSDDTVLTIKERIEDKADIPVNQQVLKKADGTLLVDLCTVGDYNIESEDELILERDFVSESTQLMEVLVKHVGGMHVILTAVDPSSSIRSLKEAACKQLQLSAEQMNAVLNGKLLTDEEATLYHSSVRLGSKVHLIEREKYDSTHK